MRSIYIECSLKCKSFILFVIFLGSNFVGYTTAHSLSPLFAFVHNDCAKYPAMRAKAIEI